MGRKAKFLACQLAHFLNEGPLAESLEKAMAPHSSTLAWKIAWIGGAWWAAVHGVAKSRTQLNDFTFMHWRRKWQRTPMLLPGESGMGEPGGLPSMGSHRVGHD